MYLNYVAQYPIHMSPILKSLRNDPDYKALPALKQGWGMGAVKG